MKSKIRRSPGDVLPLEEIDYQAPTRLDSDNYFEAIDNILERMELEHE